MKIWLPWRGMIDTLCIHPPQSIGEPTTVQHRSAVEAWQSIPCPPAQCAYQEFMGGVDLADQIQQSFSVIRKSNKPWKKLFYYGLKVCLLKAFTTLKKARQTPHDFLTFRIAIVRHLLEGKCFCARSGRPPTRPAADMDARRLKRQY